MKLLGVLNVTPDSFSDGGRYLDAEAAAVHGRALWTEGAAMVDVGGESTRPGAAPVSEAEERRRVLPVVEALVAAGVPVSIDTRRAAVAAAAIAAGAALVNDVSGGEDPEMLPLIAATGVPIVLMHMRGTPADMVRHAQYTDVVGEVWAELDARAARAVAVGVGRGQLVLDPGIGFAKSFEQNLALLRDLPRRTGRPVMLGVSRKSFLGQLAGEPRPDARLPGSLAVAIWARRAGVAWLRVHDVAATRAALATWDAVAVEAAP